MTTNIYIDVDGVLNALPYDEEHFEVWPRETWRSQLINGYQITWSTELVAALNEIAVRDNVTFKWLTTWCELAQQHIAPGLELVGADAWPVTDQVKSAEAQYGGWRPEQQTWWKLSALLNDVNTNGEPDKIVWIDDDHDYYRSSWNPWVSRKTEAGELLVVQPKTRLGLTPTHLEEIQEFIDG